MSKQLENVFASEYGISDAVCKSLDIMGYHSPTPVQEKAIGNILNHQDLIVKSKTGSGKTGPAHSGTTAKTARTYCCWHTWAHCRSYPAR